MGRKPCGHVVCVDQDDTPANREAMARRGYAVDIKPFREAHAELQVCIIEHKCRGPAPFPATGWQDERPTDGKWWCAINPQCRHPNFGPVEEIEFDEHGQVWLAGSLVGHRDFMPGINGAKWKRREVPADPFLDEVRDGK